MKARDHLFNLIRIPSVSSRSNRGVIEYANEILCTAGWSSREIAYRDANGIEKINLIAAPPQQDNTAVDVDLAIVCHTDTVPYSPSWAHALDPFIEEDLLHGCGACDVKGFLACLLEAATTPDHSWLQGLRIVLTADEEVGCVGAKYLVANQSIRPEKMVIGEPTSLRVARAGKGYCIAEIVVHGMEAHSAHPDQGASAIYAASRMIRAIEDLADDLAARKHSLFIPDFTTLNVGTIHGGTAKNIVPGECRFLVEWRPIPALPADEVSTALQTVADRICKRDSRLQINIHVLRLQSGFETAAHSPLVQAVERATARPATAIPFGSEASVFASVAQEIVVFGPGDMRTAHSDRECVPLAELDEAVSVLKTLMTSP